MNDALERLFDAVSTTTDWRLNDMTDNCQALVGYRLTVKPEAYWRDPWGRISDDGKVLWISGYTQCTGLEIIIGTPLSGEWKKSAIVHELFHALQHCSSPLPSDRVDDEMHANWVRDGIYDSIDRVNR